MSESIKIEPLGIRVLIQPLEQESQTTSGIYLPETAKEKPQTGKVIAVGDDEDINVRVNDTVLFEKYTGTEFKYDGAAYLLIDFTDILARLKD